MTHTVDVSIVIVGHNSRREIKACLTGISLQELYKRQRVETLLVDAGSNDKTAAFISTFPGSVRLIPTIRNLGFSRGNNWALRIALGRYVLLLNPDTEMWSGALDGMTAYLDAHPDVGVVAPQLRFADGQIQSSRRRFPSRWTALLESVWWQKWLNWMPTVQRFYMNDNDATIEHDVDWATGAALLIRREVFQQVGLFDESFFMYSEETDLCRRIRHAGWRVVYLPAARVTHHEGRSSEHNLEARNTRFHGSRIRYYAKHFGRLWASVVRVVTIVHFVTMLMETSAKLALSSRNRALRRSQLSMIVSVVKGLIRGFMRDRPHLA